MFHFHSLHAFFHQGGYAFTVWLAYIFVLIVFFVAWRVSRAEFKKQLNETVEMNNATQAQTQIN